MRYLVLAATVMSSWSGICAAQDATGLRVRASAVSAAAMRELAPLCGKAAGAAVEIDFANNPVVRLAIRDGAPFDAVVLETHMLDELAAEGRVAAGSIRPLASVGMALVTRADDPPVSIADEAGFRRTLRDARSIGYVADGHSGALFLQVVAKLGMTEAIASRLVPLTGAPNIADVASGKLHYIAAPVAGGLPPTLRLVGRFPESLDAAVRIGAGLASEAAPAAAAFIDCLRSLPARAVFATKGYTPAP